MPNLQTICNIIILISAVIIAIKNIYNFFKKPVTDLANKVSEITTKKIENIIDKKLAPKVDEIKEINLSQNVPIQQILDTQLEIFRYELNNIYNKYAPYQMISQTDRDMFIHLYEQYKQLGGNSWIETEYEELLTWPVTNIYRLK